VLYGAMTADSARRHYSGRSVPWRGRAADRVTGGAAQAQVPAEVRVEVPSEVPGEAPPARS
jgi:hypothetical protein